MSAHNFGPMLDAYVDRELELSQSLELEKHLETCTECSERVRSLQALRLRLSQPDMRFNAPDGLRARVLAIAENASKPSQSAPANRVTSMRPTRSWGFRFGLIAATAAIVVTSFTFLFLRSRGKDTTLASELVAAHVRSLMVDHLVDVQSTDQHTVKPWFHGKLDFAPRVDDLAQAGYPLIGGRLDYISGRSVAVLVYQRRQHPINVFEWPSTSGAVRPHNRTASGYNMIEWNENGMEYWAVSDLNYNELAAFVDLLRKN